MPPFLPMCSISLTLAAAPVVETVVDEPVSAPQTFDAGVIAAVAAIVSAVGYTVSRKSR